MFYANHTNRQKVIGKAIINKIEKISFHYKLLR